MDSQMQTLPPLKRFRLLQQQQSRNHDKENVDPARCLPAKKRKESRHIPPFSDITHTTTTITTPYCLPAKKRVWALPPEPTTTTKPFSNIDLNVAYNPSSFEENFKGNTANSLIEGDPIEKFQSLEVIEEKHTSLLVSSSSSVYADANKAEKHEAEHEEGPKRDAEEEKWDDPTEKSKSLNMKKEKGVSFSSSASDFVSGNVEKPESKSEEAQGEGEKENQIEKSLSLVIQKENGSSFLFSTDRNEGKPEQKLEESDEGEVDLEEEDDGILCAICQSTDGDPKDPIVFCDGCDLMVHTTCYGDPLVKGVPDGDWFCNQCLVLQSRSKLKNKSNSEFSDSLSCCLCPNRGGALKLTIDGSWAHIVCSLFVPEVFFEDAEGREGIDCSRVPKKRWERRCYICKCANGCAIDCSEPRCPLAFHVTCGLKHDLCIEYQEGKKKGAIVAGFCKNHTELWRKQEQTGKFKIVAREEHQ